MQVLGITQVSLVECGWISPGQALTHIHRVTQHIPKLELASQCTPLDAHSPTQHEVVAHSWGLIGSYGREEGRGGREGRGEGRGRGGEGGGGGGGEGGGGRWEVEGGGGRWEVEGGGGRWRGKVEGEGGGGEGEGGALGTQHSANLQQSVTLCVVCNVTSDAHLPLV